MFKKVLIGFGCLFLVLSVIAALKPEDYTIRRSVLINASAEMIFPYLINTKKVDSWMPWKDEDPNVQMSYSGPEEGLGSTSNWTSTGQMGTGKAEVIGVSPNQFVRTKVSYTKPMIMTQDSEFSLGPAGANTQVTWSVTGKQPFFARLMCTIMFMNMDKYVGGMFERGLAKLKAIVEPK